MRRQDYIEYLQGAELEKLRLYMESNETIDAYFTQEELRTLTTMGLLAIDSLNREAHTLSVPFTGLYVKNLLRGRQKILRLLKRGQVLEKNIKVRKLNSVFSWTFHIHDLVGSGRIERFATPAGYGLRLS
jgi:hypothetical protein